MFLEFCYTVGAIIVALCLVVVGGGLLTYFIIYRIGKSMKEEIKKDEEILKELPRINYGKRSEEKKMDEESKVWKLKKKES